MDLDGIAFVVGGGSGIGQACCRSFAMEGVAGIVVADINFQAAQLVAAECQELATNSSCTTTALEIDVTAPGSVKQAVMRVIELYKRVDYCVNCAGIGVQIAKAMPEADASEFDRFMDVNVKGTFLVTREVSAAMKVQEPKPVQANTPERGTTRGAIVNMGSVASFLSQPCMVQYTASKHAMLGVSRNAALDTAQYGIRVNCVCPSWVDTPMVRRAIETVSGLKGTIEAAVPLGRVATSEEVSQVVMFMCSPRASYITGRYVTHGFPAPGLRRTMRHITGFDDKGKSVFLSTDCGDHHRIMGDQQAVSNILYSTTESPVDINGNVDIKQAKEREPPIHYKNGTVVRMIDFAPGLESPLHRVLSLDYGVVLEGEFELTLDSGESRIMRQGDVSVQRAAAHKWRNITGNCTMPGRMLYVLLDCKEVVHEGTPVEGYLGWLEDHYRAREGNE
ncbi:hypothetical protein F4778DRAFT_773186 [Xylariomycetidae sp. FL2044]|nr:hypothetical protein F4778DRAFT_773186 [Xylariomycetidae sp. FL2044]